MQWSPCISSVFTPGVFTSGFKLLVFLKQNPKLKDLEFQYFLSEWRAFQPFSLFKMWSAPDILWISSGSLADLDSSTVLMEKKSSKFWVKNFYLPLHPSECKPLIIFSGDFQPTGRLVVVHRKGFFSVKIKINETQERNYVSCLNHGFSGLQTRKRRLICWCFFFCIICVQWK